MKELDALYNAKGQRVGAIMLDEGTLYLHKTGLDRSRHQLQKPPAWALDRQHIYSLQTTGQPLTARMIRLVDTTHVIWEIDLETFRDKSFAVGRGHGDQLAVVLKEWTQRR